MSSVAKICLIWETHFFSPSLIQKLLTYFFLRVSAYIFFSFFSPSLSSPIDRTWKIVRTAGFHTRFRYGKLVVPLVFALVLFVHSRKFTSNIHEYSIFFRGYPNGWTIAYSKYLIMHINYIIYIYIGTDSPLWEVFSLVYIYTLVTVYIFTYIHECQYPSVFTQYLDRRHDEDRGFPFDPNHVELTWNRLQFPLLCTPAIHWWKKRVSMSGLRPLPPALLLCAFSRLLWRSPDPNNTWQIECQKTCHTKMSDKNATMYVREKVGQNAREDVLRLQ